MTSGQMLKNKI